MDQSLWPSILRPADRNCDSACAIGLVKVVGTKIVERKVCLIRPPRPNFEFSWLHGITWSDVASCPSFAEIWPKLVPMLDGADFLAAHNASFDHSVLLACCAMSQLGPPALPFSCSMRLARQVWRIYPTKLPDVCAHLGIRLRHHDPGSDAEACARIVIAAHLATGASDNGRVKSNTARLGVPSMTRFRSTRDD
jgi:DNA polymerase-3 subunit epsilon